MNTTAPTHVPTVLAEGSLSRKEARSEESEEAFRWGWRIACFTVLLGASLLAISMFVWITGVRAQNDRLRSAVDSLSIERAGLEERAGFLESMRDMLVGKVEMAEDGRIAAEGRARVLGEEKAVLGEEVANLTSAVDILMDKLTNSKVRVASLEQAARAREARVGELETTRDGLLVANFDLRQEVAAARERIESLDEQNEALAAEVASLAGRERELHARLGRLSEENAAVSTENYQLQRRLAKLTHELESKDAAVTALQDHLARLEFQAELAVTTDDAAVGPAVPVVGEGREMRLDERPRILD